SDLHLRALYEQRLQYSLSNDQLSRRRDWEEAIELARLALAGETDADAAQAARTLAELMVRRQYLDEEIYDEARNLLDQFFEQTSFEVKKEAARGLVAADEVAGEIR